jgi:hypothetical protein
MSSIRSIIIGSVVAASAAAVATIAATSVTASAGTPSSGTFTVRAYHTSDTGIDLGKPGYSVGDQDLGADRLMRNGERVGWMAVSCTTSRLGHTSEDQLCEFVLHLAGSQLTSAGAVRSGEGGPGTFTLPILGGTGRYRTATGQLAITATDGPYVPITISLSH